MSNAEQSKCLVLHYAVKQNDFHTVKILLDQGYLESEAKADTIYRSLDYAADNIQMLELLLKAGASTAGKHFKKKTPLIRAMDKNNFPAVDTILSMYDVDSIDPTNRNEMIHFIIAAMRGNRKLVGCFIQKDFKVNALISCYLDDWTAYTPLHCIVKHLCVEGVKILLENGANMTIQDGDGCSPIHLAYYIWENKDQRYTKKQQYEANNIIYCLLSAHKSFTTNPTDIKGLSHLHILCLSRFDNLEITKLLSQKIDDVNAYDEHGRTALSIAALNGLTNVVNLLLEYGACIDEILLKKIYQILRDEIELSITAIVFEILVKHLKKLMLIGYPVSLETSRICAKVDVFSPITYWNEELKLLKEHKIDNDTSLYDILFKSEQDMAGYVKNTDLENELDLIEAFDRYPNYRFLLNLKFKEGAARNQILEQLSTNPEFITAAEFSKLVIKK